MLGALARAGFDDLDRVGSRLAELADAVGLAPEALLDGLAAAADPDQALAELQRLFERALDAVRAVLNEPPLGRAARLLGASRGFAEFLLRNLDELACCTTSPCRRRRPRPPRPISSSSWTDRRAPGDARRGGCPRCAWYRRLLARVAIWDLTRGDAVAAVDTVAAGLADLAGAALEAALHLARRTVGRAEGEPAALRALPGRGGRGDAPGGHRHGQGRRARAQLRQRRRRHLRRRVADDEAVPTARALDIATRLAMTATCG